MSVDQFESKPGDYGSRVKFQTANWLEMNAEKQFDAIVYDEAINNLSRIQLSLFFS